MRVVILGNGLAGTISGKTIRELDSAADIIICGEEKYPYYPRPNLIDFLAGLIPLEKVFAFAEGWAERQRLQIQLGVRATAIDPSGPAVEFEDGRRLTADYLVLATGACPATPPLPGLDKDGIFTIRTLEDVLELLEAIKSGPEVVILGGGLLGLELARALRMRGVERLSVVEVFNRLLPRQLDETGAGLLQTSLEKTGIKFFIGQEAAEILGEGRVTGVRLKDGQTIPAGVVIIAAGG
ncbi:MAG TPA: NAD(P)/FAD-dependent oxidoreductase, partial [Acidobacteria bacterium]|nr:NAD(P)/FAD-dependent oxidoreductase [Acidobacteriota bacterium]